MRRWRFCGACGCRVYRPAAMLEAPIAYCDAHAGLAAAADRLPPDPLTRLQTLAAELQRESERR